MKQRFWDRYLQKYPGTLDPARTSSVWLPLLADGSVVLSMFVANKTSGMFIRGPRGTDAKAVGTYLAQHQEVLEEAFGPSQPSRGGYHYLTSIDIPLTTQERWDKLIDWMDAQQKKYVETIGVLEAMERQGES